MSTRTSTESGFTLLEALIALLVTSFGMLAIAAFQGTLSGSSDVAKQRAEAVRLAQLKIEELRAFEQVPSSVTKFNYTDNVVSGGDTIGPNNGGYVTNTTYSRVWTVNGAATDPQKWVRVQVSWQDRGGATQTVDLQTVIARSDPAAIGTVAVGPGGITARTPKNRNVNIPYPAIGLAGGKSAFQPRSDGNSTPPFFVFDNVTGDVLGYCNLTLTGGETINFASNGNGTTTTGCTAQASYLLSGYIRFVSGNYNQNQVDNTFGNPTGATRALSADISFIAPTSTATTQCFTQRQKVVSVNAGSVVPQTIASIARTGNVVTVATSGNHGFSVGQIVSINDTSDASFEGVYTVTGTPNNTTFTYAQVGNPAPKPTGRNLTPTAILVQRVAIGESDTPPTGYNGVESTYVAYTCMVQPLDHDSNPNTRARWSGYFRITPEVTGGTAWTLGTNSNQYKMCRYTGDYLADGVLSNSEHPLYYRGVTGALDNQNYVIIDGNQDCPYDGPANTATSDYVNSNTTVHQTVDAPCTAPCGGNFSGSNNGGASRNGGIATAESSTLSIELPMFQVGD